MADTTNYTYLGYANGWLVTPEPVIEARKKGYRFRSESNPYRCVTRYYCDELKFYYDVDSSD